MSFEPLQFLGLHYNFIEYAKKYIGKYYLSNNNNLPLPFIAHYSYMWHLTPLKIIPEKTKLISLMVSNKNNAPGHKYRHILCQQILKSNLNIDIYGKGCIFYNKLNDYRVKGEFIETEPYLDYKFHIAIENFKTPHYFSEKISNPLLCNTNIIYLGCENIDNYFTNIIKLSGGINNDMDLLNDTINNPEKYFINNDINKIKKTLSIKNIINDF